MSYTVSKIYSWTNISDTGCESKLDRFNDILSSFATEVYDLYPMKTIERWKLLQLILSWRCDDFFENDVMWVVH